MRTKLDLDHARQVVTISRGLRRLGRLVVDRVKYTYLGIKPSFSLSLALYATLQGQQAQRSAGAPSSAEQNASDPRMGQIFPRYCDRQAESCTCVQ